MPLGFFGHVQLGGGPGDGLYIPSGLGTPLDPQEELGVSLPPLPPTLTQPCSSGMDGWSMLTTDSYFEDVLEVYSAMCVYFHS